MKRVSSTSKVKEETVALGYVAPRLHGEFTEHRHWEAEPGLVGRGGRWVGGGRLTRLLPT